MELFWYIVLMTMLTIYVILDGYDFGAGIIHLFFAKKEKDKKAITNAIGPFWDANEVWLIAAGGVLFFAFPTLYASSFSGFYLRKQSQLGNFTPRRKNRSRKSFL